MKFHVFGNKQNPILILIHGVQTPWQMWTTQIEHFRENYYVIVPALDGHEEDHVSEFYSIEHEAQQIEDYCIENQFKDIFAVCGASMGGAIAFKFWETGKTNIQNLVLDGAPLAPYNRFIANVMINNYLKITHKSQVRDTKTLENFKKFFLPEQYLESFLKIADNMSDTTIKNIINSLGNNKFPCNISKNETKILYMYGTKINEILSKKSVTLLKRHYPKSYIVCFKGDVHCFKCIFKPKQWIKVVENFLLT